MVYFDFEVIVGSSCVQRTVTNLYSFHITLALGTAICSNDSLESTYSTHDMTNSAYYSHSTDL